MLVLWWVLLAALVCGASGGCSCVSGAYQCRNEASLLGAKACMDRQTEQGRSRFFVSLEFENAADASDFPEGPENFARRLEDLAGSGVSIRLPRPRRGCAEMRAAICLSKATPNLRYCALRICLTKDAGESTIGRPPQATPGPTRSPSTPPPPSPSPETAWEPSSAPPPSTGPPSPSPAPRTRAPRPRASPSPATRAPRPRASPSPATTAPRPRAPTTAGTSGRPPSPPPSTRPRPPPTIAPPSVPSSRTPSVKLRSEGLECECESVAGSKRLSVAAMVLAVLFGLLSLFCGLVACRASGQALMDADETSQRMNLSERRESGRVGEVTRLTERLRALEREVQGLRGVPPGRVPRPPPPPPPPQPPGPSRSPHSEARCKRKRPRPPESSTLMDRARQGASFTSAANLSSQTRPRTPPWKASPTLKPHTLKMTAGPLVRSLVSGLTPRRPSPRPPVRFTDARQGPASNASSKDSQDQKDPASEAPKFASPASQGQMDWQPLRRLRSASQDALPAESFRPSTPPLPSPSAAQDASTANGDRDEPRHTPSPPPEAPSAEEERRRQQLSSPSASPSGSEGRDKKSHQKPSEQDSFDARRLQMEEEEDLDRLRQKVNSPDKSPGESARDKERHQKPGMRDKAEESAVEAEVEARRLQEQEEEDEALREAQELEAASVEAAAREQRRRQMAALVGQLPRPPPAGLGGPQMGAGRAGPAAAAGGVGGLAAPPGQGPAAVAGGVGGPAAPPAAALGGVGAPAAPPGQGPQAPLRRSVRQPAPIERLVIRHDATKTYT